MVRLKPDIERIRRDVLSFSKFVSPGEPGYTRISFSREDLQARDHAIRLMKEACLEVRVDPAGNIIGRREGRGKRPAILTGSHLDTVRGGGRFDGISGVAAGIEVARRLEEEAIETLHPLEFVVYLAEEPSPFGLSTIGSRAMAGKLSEDLLTSAKDSQGRSLGAAIEEIGGRPARIGDAKRSRGDLLACLELHIEQGPVLQSRGIAIGVVTGIVGIARGNIEVLGTMGHSGTTPMGDRKDALAAGSEVVLALEKICRGSEGAVGTIGKVGVLPNSLNVIPGEVHLGMEIRGPNEELLHQRAFRFREEIDRIIQKRGVDIHFDIAVTSKPVLFHTGIVDRIVSVCETMQISYLKMPSGAGHDTQHVAEIAPGGMVFVPSKDGRSHCGEEWTEFEDICLGTEVLAQTMILLDGENAHPGGLPAAERGN